MGGELLTGNVGLFRYLSNMNSWQTDRLTLEPFTPSDLDLLHQLFTDEAIRQYLWDDMVIDVSQTEDILKVNDILQHSRGYGLWKIVHQETEQVLGFTGLWFFFEEPQPQLLYGLFPAYWQQGFATEAAKSIVQYAFKDLGFDYLIAATDPPNEASGKVAMRLGMKMTESKIVEGKMTLFWKAEKQK